MLSKVKQFFTQDIWTIPLKGIHPGKVFLIKYGRIFILALKGFAEDNVQLRASALTLYSLLSIVPVMAMIFGIAKGFGMEERLQLLLKEQFTGQQQVMDWVVQFAGKYLSNIKGGFIAGIGFVILIWSILKVLGNIENSFNSIWQIKKSRVISRKISDYISLIIIAPMLLLISSSINISQISSLMENYRFLGYFSPAVEVFVSIFSLILMWLVFTLVYLIMPNTKVNFKSAFLAGVIAGTMFQILQWAYIEFQSLLSGYGAVYGSFAALPLFLMWLQFSWLIVLFGAEISFAVQNVDNYESNLHTTDMSINIKKKIALLITHFIVKNFEKGLPALSSNEISQKLDVPVRLVREIIYNLIDTGVITEIVTDKIKDSAFQPAMDINKIDYSLVLEKIENMGESEFSHIETPEFKAISNAVVAFEGLIAKSSNNILLKDIR